MVCILMTFFFAILKKKNCFASLDREVHLNGKAREVRPKCTLLW